MRWPVPLSIALLLAVAPEWSGEPRLPLFRATPTVQYKSVPLATADPRRKQVGALTYLGGLHLWSSDRAFGGFSALAVAGKRMTLLGDGGLVFAFDIDRDLKLSAPSFGAVPDGPGAGWTRADRDTESLAVDPASGRVWVGYESVNQIWRYAPGFARAEASAAPRAIRDWPQNGGAEAMVRLRSGRFVVIAESDHVARRPGVRSAVMFDRDPTDARAQAVRFGYRPPARYAPTDVAELPDGRMLVLNRAVGVTDLFTAKLVVIDPRRVTPGAVLTGPTVATLAAPVLHDNFEALAVTREGDATIVWIASDDNAPTWFQRTLLLKFRLDLPRAGCDHPEAS